MVYPMLKNVLEAWRHAIVRKLYPVRLTDSDVKRLKAVIRNKSTTETMAHRCHILLDMDENHVQDRMTYAQGCPDARREGGAGQERL